MPSATSSFPEAPRFLRGEDLNEDARARAGFIPKPPPPPSLEDHLQLAAKKGDADEIRRLVREGADVNTRDILNKTPLHVAATFGRLEAVRALKELGADPDARALGNKRPLDWANKPGSGNKADDAASLELLQSWTAGAA